MSQKDRIDWIDTAKGIGLLFVILGHLHIPYVATWIYFFHMPLFFFLSGVVYSGGKYSFEEYLRKRISSLVIPYFTYGFAIWLFYAIVNYFVGVDNGLYGSNVDMLKGLLVQEHFWTIWFLAALFLVEIMYYLLDKVFGKSILCLSFTSLLVCVFGLLRYRFGSGALPWNLDVAFVAQFFFHAGRVFKISKIMPFITECRETRKTVILLVSFLAINLMSGVLGIKIAHESLDMSIGLYGNEFLTFISAFSGIFFVIVLACVFPLRSLRYLGKNTMVIFALHSRVVIVLCNYFYEKYGIFQGNGLIERLSYAGVTFIIIMAVLVPTTELIKKGRIRFWFGV